MIALEIDALDSLKLRKGGRDSIKSRSVYIMFAFTSKITNLYV